MSRRYVLRAAGRKLAIKQLPYHIVRDSKEGESANDHNGDRKWRAQMEVEESANQDSPQLMIAGQQAVKGLNPVQASEPGWTAPRSPNPGRRKEHPELTQVAFDKLLAFLDPDRDSAGRKYEIIRRKLVKFFECRGCPIPDDLADETINHVARKIDQGQQITGDEPARYFYGVARYIIRGHWRRSARSSESTECLPQYYHPREDPAETAQRRTEEHMSCKRLEELERCLRELTEDNRELIIKYYEYEQGGKKESRILLARRLGIQSNALRLRVHRIRLKLKQDLNGLIE
jgi:RNA polymerase sigma factor (sigma-70 family)